MLRQAQHDNKSNCHIEPVGIWLIVASTGLSLTATALCHPELVEGESNAIILPTITEISRLHYIPLEMTSGLC